MNWKLMGAIMGGLAVGAVVVGILFFVISGNKKQSIDTANVPSETTPAISVSSSNKTFTSDSGFSFEYPEDVTVTENELESNQYANLTLTKEGKEGSITFTVSDSKTKTVDLALTALKIDTKSAKKNTIPLADLEAFEYTYIDGKVVVASLDQGALFLVTVDPKNDFTYWQSVYQQMANSFAFEAPEQPTTPAKKSAPAPDSSDEILYEGEEIVE